MTPVRRDNALVATCFAMATLAWGIVFYGFSFFLESLLHIGQFSIEQVSSAIGVSFWSGIPAGIVIGWWLKRGPPVWIVLYGVSAISAGLLLLPSVEHIATLFLAFILFGTGYPCLSTAGISGTLNYYIRDRYASRLSIALTGASVGGAMLVPIMVWLREMVGFQLALQFVAALLVITLVPPAIALLRRRIEATEPKALVDKNASTRATLRSPKFLSITFAATCALTGQVGFLSHQIPMLGMHIGTEQAALGVSVTAASAIFGRFLAGWLADRTDLALLAALATAIQGFGIVLLSGVGSLSAIYGACALSGFVVGAIVMLPALLIRDRFGSAAYSELYGFINIGLYAGAGFGPIVIGALRDADGDYVRGLLLLGVMQFIAVAVFFTVPQNALPATVMG